MAHKLPTIKWKQIGQNLNIIVDPEGDPKSITFKGDKATLEPIKEKLKEYGTKKSPKLFKEIMEAIQPVTTQVAKKKEREEIEAVATKSKIKKEIKETKKTAGAEYKQELKAGSERKKQLQTILNDGILIHNAGNYFLAGFESVKMPELLVDRFVDYQILKHDIQPLVNFWMWCLLNPNPIARYKLFAYLIKHRLLITPSGYFVTYRMVKKTTSSDQTGIYVDAHTGKFSHTIGQVSKMRREDCDEDGAHDCSRGLHTGSPDFIGIKLGDGYSKGEVLTKAQGGGYGTGYGASNEKVMQKFDNTFGNQAVICLVNPMHVVSVPNSDTRKLRSCELYIAKTTTPEEVLSHLTEVDYLVFDNDYASIEAEEIKAKLKDAKLQDYTDGSVEALSGKKDSATKKKLTALQAQLTKLSTRVMDDKMAPDVTPEEMMRVIQSRVNQVNARPAPEAKVVSLVDIIKVKKNADAVKTKKASPKVEEAKVEKPKAVPSKKDKPAPKEAPKPAKAKVKVESALKAYVIAEFEKKKKAKKSPKNFYVLKSSDGFKVVESKGSVPITPDMEGNLETLYNEFK